MQGVRNCEGDGSEADFSRDEQWFSGQYKYFGVKVLICLLYTSPSPRDLSTSRMPSSA